MTRVIAGIHGGRRIVTPKGSATRPTSDRTREALFSSLAARGVIDGARVLDLFAGSGALGIEAVSRGAVSAILVDQDRGAVAAMRRTITDLGLREVRVQARDVRAYLGGVPGQVGGKAGGVPGQVGGKAGGVPGQVGGKAGGVAGPMDLVFIDPPYDLGEESLARVLAALTEGWLAEDALVVVERSARSPEPGWPAALERVQAKTYGETAIWLAAYRGR